MRTDLILRAVAPLAALVALAAGAPQALSGTLALVALALALDSLTRLRGTGTIDRVLVGTGGALVLLVLTGMLLGSTPLGLSPTSWVVALALLGLGGLLLAAVVPARAPLAGGTREPLGAAGRWDRRRALLLLPWVAVATVVVVASVQLTGASLSSADAAPVQMSFGRVSGTEVDVVVSSSDAVGPLEVRTSTRGNEISYPLFDVEEDGSVTTTLSLPETGRYVVTLSYPDQTKPLRTLILDR